MKNVILLFTKAFVKVLGVLLGVLLFGILVIIALFLYKDNMPVLSKADISAVETGGNIEQYYLQRGNYETSYMTIKAEKPMKKYTIYYPSELESSSKTYPLVLITNGTGFKASLYKPVFEQLASWGFIVVGN